MCAVTLTWNGENELSIVSQEGRIIVQSDQAAAPDHFRNLRVRQVPFVCAQRASIGMRGNKRPFRRFQKVGKARVAEVGNVHQNALPFHLPHGRATKRAQAAASRLAGGKVESLDDIYRHVMHFFALGGRKNLALGSDFDGAALPQCLNTPKKAAALYEYLLARGVSQEDADGLLYRNAQTFLQKTLG